MRLSRPRLLRGAAAGLATLILAGCGARELEESAAEPSSRTLAMVLDREADHDTLARVAGAAGLADVFEGVGPYTVFAPADPAFEADGVPDFTAGERRTEGADLVRAHVVPGALTRQDIVAAIERAGGDGVAMRTMADGLLTFSRERQGIVVTAANGARARLVGDETAVRNGVVQPVDALLVRPEPVPAG